MHSENRHYQLRKGQKTGKVVFNRLWVTHLQMADEFFGEIVAPYDKDHWNHTVQ